MLMPKKVKYRKMQKGRMYGKAYRGSTVSFGEFGLKALEPGWLSSKQIEAARIAITRHAKRGCKVWIRVFPDKPVTTKGTEVPMGGGKGSVDHYVYPLKPGRIILEVDGLDEDLAREALKKAADKLPVETKFVKKDAVS